MEFSSPYTYVGNNPLKFIDPTGMFSCGTGEPGVADCTDEQKRLVADMYNNRNSRKKDPPGLWSWVTENFVEPFNDFMSGIGDYIFSKSQDLDLRKPSSPKEINLMRSMGNDFADNLENTYYEPYVSISTSKMDAYGIIPGYLGLTYTPRTGLFLNSGLDLSVSSGSPTLPFGVSGGFFIKKGSYINANDIVGGSETTYMGAILGYEQGKSFLPGTRAPFGEVQQVGFTLSGSVYYGKSWCNTHYLGSPRYTY